MKDHGSENTPWRLLAAVVIAAAAIGLAMLLHDMCDAAEPIRVVTSYANDPQGSCLWRACEDMLSANGLQAEADRWYVWFSGGARIIAGEGPVARAECEGLRYAYTTAGDERFLETCSAAGLAVAIHWPSRTGGSRYIHAIAFYGFDTEDGGAWILDNNQPGETVKIDREKFLAAWRSAGGAALTILPPHRDSETLP